MAQGHGKFDSKSFSKKELLKFKERIASSKKFNFWGYALFIGGGALQLFAACHSL